jgi:hypothetical protein
MPKLLILCLFFVAIHGHAQQLPWKGLPAEKKILNLLDEDAGDSVTVYLKLDTLHQNAQPDERDWVSRVWYQKNTVGYGYADKAGRPFGVWKYYTPAANGYELFCEGYYTTIRTDRLRVDADIRKRFASSDEEETKAAYIKALPDRFLFTDEWRFYDKGRLARIVVLNDQALLPYETMENFSEDGSRVVSTTLMWAAPQGRLAGRVLTQADVSPEGYLKNIRSEGFALEFDPKGKPVIAPLYNLD